LTVVEVRNERISDLLAGTQAAETRGQVIVTDASSTGRRKSHKTTDDDASSGRQARLEIRTDVHGDTVVQGVLSLEVENFEQVVEIWEECLANRRNRLAEQEVDISQYEASCNVIATLRVTSANITTGHGSIGKLQCVDLAGADLLPRPAGSMESSPDNLPSVGPNSEMRFAHRSLETLNEVVTARAQYVRTVPYRNSTLTHLLRDSLEADTKVLLIACISSDAKDLQETVATLRFASKMRHVTIGKATKHTLSTP
jgi:kinesin family member C2/C3